MKNLLNRFITLTLALTCSLLVQAEELTQLKQAFIIDELSIFMHAGPGTNYRILGTINAGSEIKMTGNSKEDYSEIIDGKDRTTWVESKYISDMPGLSSVVAELNGKIANATDFTSQLDGEVNKLKSTIANLQEENTRLTNEANSLQTTLTNTSNKLKGQDTALKKEWFFAGAVVLGFGLILGLVLPRFFSRRRSNMDSWQ
jgi:SH3 domain protein